MLICSPWVLLVLCLFVILVDFQFPFDGLWFLLPKFLISITSLHSQALFQFCLCIYLISSVFVVLYLEYFGASMNIFSKLVPQSSNLRLKQGILYPSSDLIVMG